MNRSEKCKIVHIAQANGGIEVYLKMFFKYFKNDKYENYVILSNQYINSKEDFEKLGVHVFIVNMYREISLLDDFKSMLNIFRILKTIKPDIVYTHSSKAGGLGRIPAKMLGAKNIYNPHGWAFDMKVSKLKKKLFIVIEKVLGVITDRVIAISQYEKDVAINNKIIKQSKITVIENAIDLDKFNNKYNKEKTLKELNWTKDDIIIGMIARISEQKSPEIFVNIAEKLSFIYPQCKFIMVGDGEQRSKIESKIEEKNMKSKFYITGWVEDPYKYLDIFHVAVLTSKWEGFGLVIPEYMAAKKPVVASNVGGIANIIENGRNGFIVENFNEEEFVHKIQIYLENNEVKDKMIEQAYKDVIKKYDFRRNVEEHESIFDEINLKLS